MSGPATVGLVVNPHAGKDIRRLVAHATVTSDATKISMARRVAAAAIEVGVDRIVVMADRARLGIRAVEGLPADVVGLPLRGDATDTTRAARLMARRGVSSLVVLGGDGTCRDVVRGWRDAPLIAVSSGTNNVFPIWTEATVVGLAAGLVATGAVPLDACSDRAKVVHLRDGAGRSDVALIDAVVVEGRFAGSRAMWEPERLRVAVCSRAEPASTGVSAVAGLLAPCGSGDAGGVVVRMAPDAGYVVRAPLAPGLFCDVGIEGWERLAEGERVRVGGRLGVIALDGERHHVLGADHEVELWVERDGPLVIDPARVLRLAADRRTFVHQRQGAGRGN